jgi:putative FmdB family regulatory protein
MPTYEFRCKTCDTVFETQRPMSQSDAPALCPDGHVETVRLLSVFASTGGRSTSSVSGADVAAAMSSAPRGCGGGCACH